MTSYPGAFARENRPAFAALYFSLAQGLDSEMKMSFPRLRGLAHARSGGEAEAVREHSSDALRAPQSALVAAGIAGWAMAPTCGRSGAAGGAERGRSFDLSPRPDSELAACAARRWRLGASFDLTPTRWRSMNMAGQSRASHGVGMRFQAGTDLEPCWNRQLTDIVAFSGPVPRFQLPASRVMRVCACVRTRAYTRGKNGLNLEPVTFIYINHIYIGSKSVPNQFQTGSSLEPLNRSHRSNGGKASETNKIAVGYSRCTASIAVQVAASTVIHPRAAKTFGLGVRSAGLDLVGSGALGSLGENGGFLRFSGAGWALVGTAMLEGMAERRVNAWVSMAAHLPVRLTRASRQEGRGGARSAPRPPFAPFARSAAPSTTAHERAGFWIGLAFLDRGQMADLGERPQTWKRMIGSGLGLLCAQPAKPYAGRGDSDVMRGNPRRNGHGRTGGAGVN